MKAIIDAIMPKAAGRPAKPEREVALEAENARLRSQLSTLQERAAMIDRLMDVVGGLASGREPVPRQRKSASKKKEDPEPGSMTSQPTSTAPTSTETSTETSSKTPSASPTSRSTSTSISNLTTMVIAMREARIPTAVCARVLRRSPATIRRRRTASLSQRRPWESPSEACCDHVRSVVRATRGLCGAASLARTCGVSRRQAALLKAEEVTLIERERKMLCQRVVVSSPAVMRGFDAMYVDCLDGLYFWLIAADAAISYRTTITVANRYDARHVIESLETDFTKHGPPLVLRIDRAACQRTPDVRAMLNRHQVLVLHGPPRHPYFYGQTERQNREHRAWLGALGPIYSAQLAAEADAMQTALNGLWARPTLGWCTSQQRWNQRSPIQVDRMELRDEVEHNTQRLVRSGLEATRAQRFATESALIERGLLTINSGGQC